MKQFNREKGMIAEDVATSYLLTKGFVVLQRNYCLKNNFQGGEIDIIAKKGERIHFIEVKARTTDKYGLGREAVTVHKQKTIRKVATVYLLKHKLYDKVACSFDIIEIGENNKIEYFENCF